MLAYPKPTGRDAAPERDATAVGIDALAFIASHDDLTRRFLDLTGLTVERLREEASTPGFFIGVLDFILGSEDDLMDFAGATGLDPADVGRARDRLERGQEAANDV